MFSTDSDISRSLEIVYKEPESDTRRKLSERYRHSSSSNSDEGESPAEKLEKKKPSVTMLKNVTSDKSSESSEDVYELKRTGEVSPNSSGSISPPSGKKTPSPTKIRQPVCSASLKEQVSEEIISPVLDVQVQTPEKTGLKDTCKGSLGKLIACKP